MCIATFIFPAQLTVIYNAFIYFETTQLDVYCNNGFQSVAHKSEVYNGEP